MKKQEKVVLVVTSVETLVLPMSEAMKVYVALIKEGIAARILEYSQIPVCVPVPA